MVDADQVSEQPQVGEQQEQTGQEPERFDAEYVGKLRKEAADWRSQLRETEKQLRDAAKQAEAGSAAQKQLAEMADAMTARDVQMQFYDEAHSQGVSNLKLAYLAATDAGLIDQRGRVNWEQMKKSFPQLFGMTGTHPAGNAGSGTTNPPSSGKDMNAFIRAGAGR